MGRWGRGGCGGEWVKFLCAGDGCVHGESGLERVVSSRRQDSLGVE